MLSVVTTALVLKQASNFSYTGRFRTELLMRILKFIEKIFTTKVKEESFHLLTNS